MSFDSGNTALIAALKKSFGELYAPLDASIRAIWRGREAPPDGRAVLKNHLITTAKHFINLRDCNDEEKQKHFESVCLSFNLPYDAKAFPLYEPEDFFTPPVKQRLDRVPVSITYLEEYDQRHGSNYADRARHALFQFANLVVKFDGKVTKAEEDALLNFKQALYPPEAGSGVERKREEEAQGATAKEKEKEHEEEAIADEPPRPLEELMQELESLVGLERVKAEVKQLTNFLKVQQMREAEGMARLPLSRHLVFYGNPGTGKTTIARLLAQVFRTLKILSRGHLVETDRSGLVAGYIGQTAIRVKEVVGKSLGGVLFIDEAYALNPGEDGGKDFGSEAIETLLKLMEDHRDDLIVVVAGYTLKMDEFINSNPGLRSRFNRYIHFADYTPEQLVAIFKGFCKKADFKVTVEAEQKLLTLFSLLYETRDETFGNARTARNLFELSISRQANRIVSLAEVNKEVLATIEAADIPDAKDLAADL